MQTTTTTTKSKSGNNKGQQRSRKNNNEKDTIEKTTAKEEESEGELCFICTEPFQIYAVAQCDHRTCHRCTLRLRALYETRNCAYCKAEQKVVIFTKDAEKPFDQYLNTDTPFTNKKLCIKFETQEIYKEAMHMLNFNCPQNELSECFKNWGELKQHVRKEHSLNICDLCSRHKKVFPYEHTLYTSEQLTKHHREGDKDFNKEDETGFSGHPECAFCKTRYFGDDELFIHCRDMHEQCFLCVRNGNRHEYYANYNSLEEHFKSNHSMCLYPQCLEKKFVVFDSPIDLKSHEVEVHGESLSGLQRSMQTDARKLETNFQYDSYRNQQQQQRGSGSGSSNNNNRRNNNNNNGKKKDEITKSNNKTPSASGASTPALTNNNEFPSMNPANEALSPLPRTVPGASSKKGKGKALQKPAGFGALSSTNDSGGTADTDGGGGGDSSSSSSSSSTNTNAAAVQNDSMVASHAAFLSKVGEILKTKEKVAEFRSLTGAYRKNTLSGEEYVNQIVQLTNNSIENSGKIFKGVEDLLDIVDKKWELIRVWRNKQTAMSHFPALDVRERPPQPKASRVLVIKPKQTKKVVGLNNGGNKSKNAWDKVASAATVEATAVNNSGPSSEQSSARSSPQSSRPSSPSNTFRTPRNGSSDTTTTNISSSANTFPTLKPKTFPSLPAAAPKHRMILNMRRTAPGQQINNAWGGSNGSSGDGGDGGDGEDSSAAEESSSKKKGKKNKVLFRVGL